jgi:lipopolysaccharide biosynthesis protein
MVEQSTSLGASSRHAGNGSLIVRDSRTNPENSERVERLIAFYLPQFHPIPQNDKWWGKGFTEWRNVVGAKPLFRGHYQPRLPADLGFYDLRLEETREAQAELAREYGIHGFCYYHYWFNGRRILERPFNEVLSTGKPRFPFCLCWANENWTRRWDGLDQDVLLRQEYDHDDDRNHIRSHFTAFEDDRYIRIDNKPLFLVYRIGLLPDPQRTAEIWREEALNAGIGEIFLASVDSIGRRLTPSASGFDATVEFAPDWQVKGHPLNQSWRARLLRRSNRKNRDSYNIYSYESLVRNMLSKPEPAHKQFRCVTPSWDKTARRQEKADIWIGSTPEKYGAWLSEVLRRTKLAFPPSEQIVFVNAWNEWAEGCYLEPDQRFGRAYLEATWKALHDS